VIWAGDAHLAGSTAQRQLMS